jgi:hypothetical protein
MPANPSHELPGDLWEQLLGQVSHITNPTGRAGDPAGEAGSEAADPPPYRALVLEVLVTEQRLQLALLYE